MQCAEYFGNRRDSPRDIKQIYGNVPSQLVKAREFVAARVQRGEAPSSDQVAARPVYRYPMIAVREIIANALVHRDYEHEDGLVHVRLFPDRLEISSPGDWYGRSIGEDRKYTLDDLRSQSIRRNFTLAQCLSWIKLVEGEGSGIPAAIADCISEKVPIPTVAKETGFVTVVVLPREDAPPSTASAFQAARSFHSHIEPRTGAVSRWVAGTTSNQRFVFLAFLSHVTLTPDGRPAVHELYGLSRYSSRSLNPLEDYQLRRRSTRRNVKLEPGQNRKENLATIEEVDLGLLVDNREVLEALSRLFRTVGHVEPVSRHSRGFGSMFDRAFRCASAFVSASKEEGVGEVEATVYYRNSIDLKLKSVYRVGGNLEPVPTH